jgi:peptidoglycan-associated lipoprotein
MFHSNLVAMLLLSVLLIFSGCAKNTDSDNEIIRVPEKAKTASEPVVSPSAVVDDEKGLEAVFFDFDSFALTPVSQEVLKNNAEWLKENPEMKVIIEGYSDERGSAKYNLVLGERRAQSAKKYLAGLGVSPDRLDVISFGEERPASEGHEATAWKLNRRVEFSADRH